MTKRSIRVNIAHVMWAGPRVLCSLKKITTKIKKKYEKEKKEK